MTRAPARTRSGYRPSLGSGSRCMDATSSHPPAIPTTAPTASCTRNSPAMRPAASRPAAGPAASRLAMRAMPTGSLAPDSPSRMVPLRPAISRRPRTENTTAGSVGASAVPSSSAGRQSRPNRTWTSTARAAVVTKVPATPTQTTGPAAPRNRRQPMCIPPSNRITTSATDTTRWTVVTDSSPSAGTRSEANAAPTRKIAGAGTRIRSLSRLTRTAAMIAPPTTSTSSAKCSTSRIAALLPLLVIGNNRPGSGFWVPVKPQLQGSGGPTALVGAGRHAPEHFRGLRDPWAVPLRSVQRAGALHSPAALATRSAGPPQRGTRDMDERTAKVGELLHEAAETHHQVFRITDGADDDWASWYAQWLVTLSELPELVGATVVRSELTWLLVGLDKQYTERRPDHR